MHHNSKLIFEKYAKQHFKGGMRVLEIGPDRFPSSYLRIVWDDAITWETLDLYQSDKLTYISTTGYRFPIPTGTFDIVLSGQVIEHVKKVWLWMKEVARVCKQGGLAITINPVSWPFHEAPVDCWRIYPEGMKALHEDAGLETKLSVFEALEPCGSSSPPVVDTISIGIKKCVGSPRNGKECVLS